MSEDPLGLGSKEWAAAIKKLIETVEKAVGAVASPFLRVQNAKADVKVAKILAQGEIDVEALRVKALPPKPEDQPVYEVIFDADSEPENVLALPERSQERVEYQEQKRQLNIENVIVDAAKELKDAGEVSETPVDDDWTAKFFSNVQDVSNVELRKLWSKILAREVAKPGLTSTRTLEVLKDISPSEAKLFETLCTFAARDGHIVATKALSAVFPFHLLMLLSEAGLCTAQSMMNLNFKGTPGSPETVFGMSFTDCFIHVQTEGGLGLPMAAKFTTAGNAIARLNPQPANRDQVDAVMVLMRQSGATVRLLSVVGETDDYEHPVLKAP